MLDLRKNYSSVVATLALVVAIAGGTAAIALPRASVGTAQLKNNSVTSVKVKNLTLDKIDFKGGVIRPSSAAGGDLTGSYPNPSLADASVTAAKTGSRPVAIVSNQTTQSIPNNTGTRIAFDLEQVDTDSIHDPVTNNNRLTVPMDGIYQVSATVWFASNVTGFRDVEITMNGLSSSPIAASRIDATSSITGMNASGTAKLVAGDYVDVYVFQSSGGALNVFGQTQNAPARLSLVWLAPSS